MKCDRCNTNEAKVYIEQDINGHRHTMKLCAECASSYNMNLAINDALQNFINSFKAFGPDHQKPVAKEACPQCSMTYEQLKRKGSLGCAKCFEFFERELNAVFTNIQPGVRHTGKIPRKYGAFYLHDRELNNLRNSLKIAVKNEEYEEAARIRDIIKSMEEGYYAK